MDREELQAWQARARALRASEGWKLVLLIAEGMASDTKDQLTVVSEPLAMGRFQGIIQGLRELVEFVGLLANPQENGEGLGVNDGEDQG